MNYLVLEETFKDSFNSFLKNYAIYLAIAIAVGIAFVVTIILLNKRKK